MAQHARAVDGFCSCPFFPSGAKNSLMSKPDHRKNALPEGFSSAIPASSFHEESSNG